MHKVKIKILGFIAYNWYHAYPLATRILIILAF